MASSLTWREYESDHGTKYSIRLDKSNANLLGANTGIRLAIARTSTLKLAPKTLILRRVHCISNFNNNIKRSFVWANKAALSGSKLEIGEEYIYSDQSTPGDLGVVIWVITGYSGEKFSCPMYINNIDTGLNDGTPFIV